MATFAPLKVLNAVAFSLVVLVVGLHLSGQISAGPKWLPVHTIVMLIDAVALAALLALAVRKRKYIALLPVALGAYAFMGGYFRISSVESQRIWGVVNGLIVGILGSQIKST